MIIIIHELLLTFFMDNSMIQCKWKYKLQDASIGAMKVASIAEK